MIQALRHTSKSKIPLKMVKVVHSKWHLTPFFLIFLPKTNVFTWHHKLQGWVKSAYGINAAWALFLLEMKRYWETDYRKDQSILLYSTGRDLQAIMCLGLPDYNKYLEVISGSSHSWIHVTARESHLSMKNALQIFRLWRDWSTVMEITKIYGSLKKQS